jgi:hypothetical protein
MPVVACSNTTSALVFFGTPDGFGLPPNRASDADQIVGNNETQHVEFLLPIAGWS